MKNSPQLSHVELPDTSSVVVLTICNLFLGRSRGMFFVLQHLSSECLPLFKESKLKMILFNRSYKILI